MIVDLETKLGVDNDGRVFCIYDYEAQNPDELTVHCGDRLSVLRRGDDKETAWWWVKATNGKEGYVAKNLLAVS